MSTVNKASLLTYTDVVVGVLFYLPQIQLLGMLGMLAIGIIGRALP